MARRAKRRATRVRNLLYPVYLVPSKGGPGLQLHLRNGRWRVAHLGPRVTTAILAAPSCGRSGGRCSGRCSAGKSCQRIVRYDVEYFEIPEGIPAPPSGRTGFVVTRTREECKCLSALVGIRRRMG